jgi:hypothetical protein
VVQGDGCVQQGEALGHAGVGDRRQVEIVGEVVVGPQVVEGAGLDRSFLD